MKQKFDPNLREAMDEIRQIMKRRNIGSHVLLASETHTEFAMMFDVPTWSSVSFEQAADGGLGIRIKSKASNPDDRKKLSATTHMLCSFQDMMANGYSALELLILKLRDHVTILHLNRIGVEPDSVPTHLPEG